MDSSNLYGLESDVIVLEGIQNFYERKDGSFDDDSLMTFEFGSGLKIVVKAESLRFSIEEKII